MNVALLGHVDAGKSTLARRLGQLPSTAAFNHAEGRQNTVDLGYSSLLVDGARVSLIDCPGHASLIKAVVAASTVIDAAIVVINATKGVETQSAEHLLLASLFCPDNIIFVLSKVDIATEEQCASAEKSVRRALKTLGLAVTSPLLSLSLLSEDENSLSPLLHQLSLLVARKRESSTAPNAAAPLLLAVDHCFAVKGKGTVLTGSVLEGTIRPGDEIEIAHLQEKRRVRELESWKEKRTEVCAGERAAMLVAALSGSPSRCLAAAPGVLAAIHSFRATVHPIAFFRHTIKSGSKIHVSCGFEMEMATVRFGRRDEETGEYESLAELSSPCTAFLSMAAPLFSRVRSFYIASRLELQAKGCRFAFHGHLEEPLKEPPRFFSRKVREGEVERVADERTLICRGLFKKETKQSIFHGMQVQLESGETAVVEGAFGASGKTRLALRQSLSAETRSRLADSSLPPLRVFLHLKKFLHDSHLLSYIPQKMTVAAE